MNREGNITSVANSNARNRLVMICDKFEDFLLSSWKYTYALGVHTKYREDLSLIESHSESHTNNGLKQSNRECSSAALLPQAQPRASRAEIHRVSTQTAYCPRGPVFLAAQLGAAMGRTKLDCVHYLELALLVMAGKSTHFSESAAQQNLRNAVGYLCHSTIDQHFPLLLHSLEGGLPDMPPYRIHG